MAWDLKAHEFHHSLGRHYAVLHDPTTGAEHHLVIYTGHDSCPTCGHVKPKANTGELDFKAILRDELAAYAKKFNVPAAKVAK
jgi:hypothetical protein